MLLGFLFLWAFQRPDLEAQHWHRLPKEAVGAPSLGVLQARLDVPWSSLDDGHIPAHGGTSLFFHDPAAWKKGHLSQPCELK